MTKEKEISGSEENEEVKFNKKIFIILLVIVILGGSSYLYYYLTKCGDILCEYDKLKNDVDKAEFICSNLVKGGEPYISVYNMSSNIFLASNAESFSIINSEAKLSGRFIGSESKILKSVVCDVPVDYYFYEQNFYDYYVRFNLRPLVVVENWRDWIGKT